MNSVLSRKLSNRRPLKRGFTLIEVLLAILIAIGILVVALVFYQQAANLRQQLLQETERIATMRLLMDRITTELRTTPRATLFQKALIGTSNSIEFVKTDVPSYAAWTGGALGRAVSAETDLKRVRYRIDASDSTNITGLIRLEEPLVPTRRAADTNLPPEIVEESSPDPFSVSPGIQFLRFRFWDGTAWQDAWNAPELPRGVEVSLGSEAPAETSEPQESPYPDGMFRRVVYLPASGASSGDLASSSASEDETPEMEDEP